MTSIREQYLNKAAELTCGDRNKAYGEPYGNLTNISRLWTAYLIGRYGEYYMDNVELTAEDVAWLNVLQKMARTFSGKVSPDTYIDAASYSAIAGECAGKEETL
jgi:hypothetical protein